MRQARWAGSPTRLALLLFNALGALAVYALQRLQAWLPLNPQKFAALSPDSAFNTAVSFITNTNWQGYAGESTMSYLTQMAGLAVQNFLSAATGIVVAIALIRGLRPPQLAHHRQFLGRPDARDALCACCRSRCVLALVLVSAGRDPELQRLQGCDDRGGAHLPAAEDGCRRQPGQGRRRQPGARRRSPRRRRRCRWAGRLAGERSRSSAPTAAASSTPTRRTRTRTRRRSRTCSRCWRS